MNGAFVLAVAFCLSALGQEDLETILDRGHVADWLIVGPLPPDVDGGIAEAVRRGEAPLSARDYLAPIGGAAAARPQAGTRLALPEGTYTFEPLRAAEPPLIMEDLGGGAREWVAYAVFYCTSRGVRTAYFDLQTPLGARVWVNGFPVRTIPALPPVSAGVDRFLARFRTGTNRVILEVPLAALDAIAGAEGVSAEQVLQRGFPGRPLLVRQTGFQFAMRLLPVRALGDIAFVSRLAQGAPFNAEDGTPCQGALLTLFNPTKAASSAITVRVNVPGVKEVEQIVLPIPPGAQHEALLAAPTGGLPSGRSLPVELTLTSREARAEMRGQVVVGPPPAAGEVRVVTGMRRDPAPAEEARSRMERRLAELDRHVAVAQADSGYGFYLGETADWETYLATRPANRAALNDLVEARRAAPQSGYTTLDQRIVSGELIAANQALGYYGALSQLGSTGGTYYAWDGAALCPQYPQIGRQSRVLGVVTDLPAPGLEPLQYLAAPSGDRLLARRKAPTMGPQSLEQLVRIAEVQRREMLAAGLATDVWVNTSVVAPPEPFLMGAGAALTRGEPKVLLDGAGGDVFFERSRDAVRRGGLNFPESGGLLTLERLGELFAQPDIKLAHGMAEARLWSASAVAAWAHLTGSSYPLETLDHAMRRLLALGRPDRLGFTVAERSYLDALATYRDVIDDAQATAVAAIRDMAERVDTQARAPQSTGAGTAVVVFNPSAWNRTDVVAVETTLDPATGLTALDDNGAVVPFETDTTRAGPLSVIRFVARDVPSMGVRTYYLAAGGAPPADSEGPGTTLENDTLAVSLDPARGGAIGALVHKPSGTEFVSSVMNQPVAIPEDSSKTAGGRDVWSAGPGDRCSATATISVRRTPIAQTAYVSAPFAGGTVAQEIRLYEGVPRLDCRTRFSGVDMEARMLAVALGCYTQGGAPVAGERYGMSVGRFSPKPFDFRTDGSDNPSATGLQPALGWAGLSPNDHLLFGLDTAVPLLPTQILYPDEAGYDRAAAVLLDAFVRRGTPCSALPSKPAPTDPIWTDSTAPSDPDAELLQRSGMRIVIGTGDNNEFVQRFSAALPTDIAQRFQAESTDGTALFALDTAAPAGIPPIPTLAIGAATAAAAVEFCRQLGDGIATQGVAQLPLRAYLPLESGPMGGHGVALLFPGTRPVSATADGDLVMGLAHPSAWEGAYERLGVDPTAELVFDYAIYPFLGDWRAARVPHEAQAWSEPLLAVTTGIHSGPLPPRYSFLQFADDRMIVTLAKPAGYPLAEKRGASAGSRGELVIRAYEPFGTSWQADVTFPWALRSAQTSDALEMPGEPQTTAGQTVPLRAPGFGIETWRFSFAPAVAPDFGQGGAGSGPRVVHSDFWEHNAVTAPAGNLPVSIRWEGGVSDSDARPTVTVANNRTDQAVDGSVEVTASSGWNLTPTQFSYYLRPGESVRREIVVLRSGSDPGGLVATTTVDGRVYRDVLLTGPAEVKVSVERTATGVTAETLNRGSVPLVGELALIVPPAWWGTRVEDLADHVTPAKHAVNLPPLGNGTFSFRIDGIPPPHMTLRLTANGETWYRAVVPSTSGETQTLNPEDALQ